MSILDEIEARRNAGDLALMEPSNDPRILRVPTIERRTLYVSPAIYEFVKSNRSFAADTEADFYDFIFGERFDVALELDHQYCFMARLDEASEEIWEIRIWEPTPWEPKKPQLRFFGRFAGRNLFIALIGPVGKWTLDWKQYERMKKSCTDEWKRLFSYSPVEKGDDIDAYLSNVDLI